MARLSPARANRVFLALAGIAISIGMCRLLLGYDSCQYVDGWLYRANSRHQKGLYFTRRSAILDNGQWVDGQYEPRGCVPYTYTAKDVVPCLDNSSFVFVGDQRAFSAFRVCVASS
jgi:hypothetical protein